MLIESSPSVARGSRLAALSMALGIVSLAGCATGGYGYGADYGGYGAPPAYGAPPVYGGGPWQRDSADAARDYNRRQQGAREYLAESVRAVLRADRRLGPSIIVESPEPGVIVLGGAPAGGINQIPYAADVARRVPGVREVVNRMATY